MDDEDFNKLGIPKEGLEVRAKDFTRQGEYGPATFRGFTWVGKINKVFMEVWKRDPNTGLARRSGDRVDLLRLNPPLQIQFRLRDFLRLSPTDNRAVTFGLGKFRDLLKAKIMELAVDRCRRMLRDRAKIKEGQDDQD